MKLILLSRYDRRGASSRLRILDHVDWLADQGIQAVTAPFFDETYLTTLYRSGRRPLGPVIRAYARRLRDLLVYQDEPGLLWIEKELLPWLPLELETALIRQPFVLDFDDAWWERYADHPNPAVRAVLGRKLERLAAAARLVIVGNRYLRDWALAAGARHVVLIPTALDVESYDPLPTPRRTAEDFVIGWVGTPTNLPFLVEILPALQHLTRGAGTILRVLGSGGIGLPGVRAEFRPWQSATEAFDIASFDVGIMPLPDTPWTRGKCGFKILQYFAAGRPAIASPVGANTDIINHGVNGFLAGSLDDWRQQVARLRDDPALCASMGAAGRQTVEDRFAEDRYRRDLLAALKDAAG